MTVDKENMKKWVAALRSGEYEQGRSALRRNDQFCCLGVACEAAIKDGVKVQTIQSDGWICYDGACSFLPRAVQWWLGLPSHSALIGDHPVTELNDLKGWTFDQIADGLEAEYGLLDDEVTV